MALKEFELGTQGTSTYLFCHLLLFLSKSDFPPMVEVRFSPRRIRKNSKSKNGKGAISQGHCLLHRQPI